jgi:catechol 2,3-dioxygenase-like lactoylglutathione lyase family enzyme
MPEEFYPMPSFVTLAVADLTASTQWYQSVPGFRLVFSMPGPGGVPVLAHLRLSKYADLLLARARTPLSPPRGAGVQLNFALDGRTVDDLAAHVRSQWAHCEGPVPQPWNAREFYVTDPDGYRLAFIEQAQPGRSLDDVIERVAGATPPRQG